jgi:diaminohydroxyphosphoribosylaminopyrimidine deaminase/5-amino-6-(5-phosphoribosylamino)uracil reductase
LLKEVPLALMNMHKKHMQRCLELAKLGMSHVAPNPMVGCVIVHNNNVVAVGYHEKYGESHAEVNAINALDDKSILSECTLYVNLEPCSHQGKTPPCADLIITHNIPKVVIGCIDSYSEVAGKGVEKLEDAGIDVELGLLEQRALDLNKRFFTFHNKQRPYIILKWAETQDGFIDIDRKLNPEMDNWITSPFSKNLVHQWRSEEQAIMIGTNTALNDNPKLTVREVKGNNPIRIVLDLNLRLPQDLNVFDQSVPTIVFNYEKSETVNNIDYIQLKREKDLIEQVLEILYQRNILSVIIEGGAQLLNTFIDAHVWDEARVFVGNKTFESGLKAPHINLAPINSLQFDTDTLKTYINA